MPLAGVVATFLSLQAPVWCFLKASSWCDVFLSSLLFHSWFILRRRASAVTSSKEEHIRVVSRCHTDCQEQMKKLFPVERRCVLPPSAGRRERSMFSFSPFRLNVCKGAGVPHLSARLLNEQRDLSCSLTHTHYITRVCGHTWRQLSNVNPSCSGASINSLGFSLVSHRQRFSVAELKTTVRLEPGRAATTLLAVSWPVRTFRYSVITGLNKHLDFSL